MEKNKLGQSNIMVSPLAFGAWAIGGWMWGGADKKDAIEAIHKSIEFGITTIDTAPVYGFGLSEEITGEAIKGRRDKLEILTKFGLNWTSDKGYFHFATKDTNDKNIEIYKYAAKEAVIKECEDSLKRLKIDYIDLLQIHWPDPATPVEETMDALRILKEQGKILEAGVCNYDTDLLDKARKHLNIVSNQVSYSMLKRDIENDLIPYCVSENIGILAYSPMQRGILTGKFNPDHTFRKGDNRAALHWYKKENVIRINHFLDKLKAIAIEKNASLAQIVLKWTLQQTGITCVLAGARNPEQVEENAGALNISLSDEEIEIINGWLSKLTAEISA